MKFFICILFLLSSINSFAKECKTVDLSARGEVLHPLRATNQDGLGICHIEQLQRMLKAKMKGSPDLARVSLAIIEKSQRDLSVASTKKKAVRWKGADGLPGGTFIDAGNACDAYHLVKGEEICEAEFDQIENFTKTNAYDQKKILDALSLFFDGSSQNLNLTLFPTKLMSDLILSYKRNLNSCPLLGLGREFISLYKALGGKSENINSLPNLDVRKYFNSANFNEYVQTFAPDLKDLLKQSKELTNEYKYLIKMLLAQEKCATENLTRTADYQCLLGDSDIKRIFSLSSLGFSAKDLYRFLNFAQDRDDYFKSASLCNGKKHKIPTTFSCDIVSLIEIAKKAKNNKEYVGKFSDEVSKSLKEKTPLGISVCTRFFKNPNVQTIKKDFSYGCGNKEDPHYKSGEGSHAVTIIGERCRGEKKEFLVHNSWGKGCGYYAPEYECNKNGGFWVGAEVLANNARALNILK